MTATPTDLEKDAAPAAPGRGALAHAVSDAADRLVMADEPLATLQLRCGGEIPGPIAIPALLEVIRKARRYALKLARPIEACDGTDTISAWVEAQPRSDGEPGCDIIVRGWRTAPLPVADTRHAAETRAAIERQVAELAARLDGEQRLLSVESEAPDLAALILAMRAGLGLPWTDFVEIADSSHRQPLHWRLLDGAHVLVPGSDRHWRAHLLASQAYGASPTGFELLLCADEPLVAKAAFPPDRSPPESDRTMIGQEIAPVLKQPIARIIANAETIRTRLAGPLADEYATYASEIASAGKHLLHLLEDLADLEVVESDSFSTAPDRIDLADVARQASGILGVRARERQISIDAPKLGESLGAVAEFRRVLQILLNLIGNAIRYSPEGSGVWVRLERAAERARVIVADQGPGLTEEQAAIVFEKFERLGRGGDGGSGLGLYISRRLARAMGGELSVESAPGQGARFILELPAAELE
ncbi:MAG TPA: HAMP domain-containing sensor histidine kinase [Novosphingobium sp.]|nr:HAMP domain-containing sensor histidine kinase [Novosphingobium sp.]